jgi:hypothetical protein
MKPLFTKCGNFTKFLTRILKMSLYRLEESLRVAEVGAPRISGKSPHEDAKVTNHTHRPPLNPRDSQEY